MQGTIDQSCDARGAEQDEAGGSDDPGGPSHQHLSQSASSGSSPNPVRFVTIDDSSRLSHAQTAWLERHVIASMRALKVVGEVRGRIVGDAAMTTAHEQYCGAPGTTDVITFDLTEGAAATAGAALDTDLLLCADEAERQATSRGLTIERELLLYVLHGILHCLGYEDGDEASFRKIHEREDEILAAIGVGPTFGSPDSDGARSAERE